MKNLTNICIIGHISPIPIIFVIDVDE